MMVRALFVYPHKRRTGVQIQEAVAVREGREDIPPSAWTVVNYADELIQRL